MTAADRAALLEDRRMWRLLLARLHPDAGGDQELFLFVCALKEEAYPRRCSGGTPIYRESDERRAEGLAEPFLRTWRDAMSCWASRNREALKSICSYYNPRLEAREPARSS